ncbi:glutamine-hydrolyzing GMP synthase [Candidatus Roizmanbacteria bacterium]|nr:glutamine-hydrolyzing GMP synthase [Candidatus Roizmanbacteria bacterium]
MIVIVDFGSQTTHLIGRRIREMGCDVVIVNPEVVLDHTTNVKGIILSGGPASVYGKGSPTIDKKIFELNIPVLGICYGEQIISYLLGGEVKPGKKKEYGPATLTITDLTSPLLKSLPQDLNVWMSHGDAVVKIPPGFKTTGVTETIPYAVIENEKKKMYGIQFHPEVVHTQFGEVLLQNFLTICNIHFQKHELDVEYVNNMIEDIKESIGEEKAICALSGGVDSSVAALLVHKAIGHRLTSIYIDSGLMRKDETKTLREVFKTHYRMNVKIVHAGKLFLKNLKGVTDPEQKRKVIGKTFIKVLEIEAKKLKAHFLVQGTIYPDIIESAGTKHASKIKSHHNVGGLPKNMKLGLVEPLRNFYKDEVRKAGSLLGMSDSIVQRRPFPGPGLAIRIIGEVTERKLAILRACDAIVKEEVKNAGLELTLWQAFAIFTGLKTTGVRGDERVYGETIAIRAIEAKDAMSAHWARIPYEVMDKMSVRIVNEVRAVNRVVYDISNKPPATMEWE